MTLMERTSRHAARGIVAASLAGLVLGGCKTDQEYAALADPAHRHPILVSQVPQTMDIRVGRNAHGLTGGQRAELLAFADRARASDAGNSRIVISAPAGAANESAAMSAVGEIRRVFEERGFSEASIAVEAYPADINRHAPVRVAYLRYVAQSPDCGSWPTNLARERENTPYPNFGCATQRNFAVMVANPGDLLGPRTESDRPSERRDAVWDKYIQGESTTAKKVDDEKVKVKKDD